MDVRRARRVEEPSRRAEGSDRPVGKGRPDGDKPDKDLDRERSGKPRISPRDRLRRHPYLAAGGAIALVLLIAAGVLWWLHARQFESTDDAFIDTRSIS